MHLSKSRLKKKGSKPQMSAGREGTEGVAGPHTSLPRNSSKELFLSLPTQALVTRTLLPGLQAAPASALRSPLSSPLL